ncbi:DUF6193 family natural product biosynthesis protein [Kitasatospora sp. NPDC002227]|uniref:DUF6193 family natural product biosynthesis protein n=1 Tax=Kitasatospora sp. NPDC002227 TaxID=3154773 RepID=UPI00331ABC4B
MCTTTSRACATQSRTSWHSPPGCTGPPQLEPGPSASAAAASISARQRSRPPAAGWSRCYRGVAVAAGQPGRVRGDGLLLRRGHPSQPSVARAQSGAVPTSPDRAAVDPDPARLTESEWQGMRREASELRFAWQETYQALIEAAYAEPALRALYPFTSHWALRFSTTTRPRLTAVGPCLMANSDGTYGVGRGFSSQDLGQFSTAHEAVAQAVRHLPSGLSPVALGE